MRTFFLEKSYIKCGGETIPRLFSEKFTISLDQYFESFTCFVFIVCQVKDYRKSFELSYGPLAFISYKAFFKNKRKSGASLAASFSGWFLKKNISVIFYYLTKFQCLVVFTSWNIGQYVYCNCLLTIFWL